MAAESNRGAQETVVAREHKEAKMPMLHFELFFGQHATAEDAEAFLKKAKRADIIGFEKSGAGAKEKKFLEALSGDGVKSYKVQQTDNWVFDERLLQGIQELKKPVLLADLNRGLESSLYDMYNSFHDKQLFEADLDFRDGNLDAAMRRIKMSEILFVKSNEYRDRIIAARLEPRAKKLLKQSPHLHNKDSLLICFFLGRAHTPIMRERSLPHSARMNVGHSYLKSHFEQVYHLRRRKKDVPDLLYMRMLAESAIRLFLKQKYAAKIDDLPLLEKILDATHLIAQRLDEKDIRALSESLGKAEGEHVAGEQTEESFFLPGQMEIMDAYTAKIGMPVPATIGGLDTFITAYGPQWKIPSSK